MYDCVPSKPDPLLTSHIMIFDAVIMISFMELFLEDHVSFEEPTMSKFEREGGFIEYYRYHLCPFQGQPFSQFNGRLRLRSSSTRIGCARADEGCSYTRLRSIVSRAKSNE